MGRQSRDHETWNSGEAGSVGFALDLLSLPTAIGIHMALVGEIFFIPSQVEFLTLPLP